MAAGRRYKSALIAGIAAGDRPAGEGFVTQFTRAAQGTHSICRYLVMSTGNCRLQSALVGASRGQHPVALPTGKPIPGTA